MIEKAVEKAVGKAVEQGGRKGGRNIAGRKEQHKAGRHYQTHEATLLNQSSHTCWCEESWNSSAASSAEPAAY